MKRRLVASAAACGMVISIAVPAQDASPGAPPTAPSLAMPSGAQIDCNALAGLPNSPLSVKACRQLTGSAQQSATALAETHAAHPGDEAMTCQDIAREMSTLQGIGLSDASRKEGEAASTQYQQIVGAQLAQLRRQGELGAAATTAAAAADLAIQMATGGLVNPHAAQAVQQSALAAGLAQGEVLSQQRRPAEERLTKAAGNETAEMAAQLQANPRFARLVNLAVAKNCKAPGNADTSAPSPMLEGKGPIGR